MSAMRMVRLVLTVGVVVLPVAVLSAGSPEAFTSEAASRGVVFQTVDSLYRHGTGLGVIDLDNDQDPDLVVLGGTSGIVGLFENDGTGHFIDRSIGNEILLITEATGLSAADFDADGDLDLMITCRLFNDVLLRNDGNFEFTNVAPTLGLGDEQGLSYGTTWGDIDGDGWLELYVANRTFLPGFAVPNELYVNSNGLALEATGETLGVGFSQLPSFTSRFLDYDRDGDADLYVCNDRGTTPNVENHLFRNDGGTFVDVTAASNTAANVDCMGIAVGDLDRNGYADMYVTNTPPGNVLLMNQGDGTFVDATLAYDVGSYEIGWGTTFLDYDNDGKLELYVNNMLAPNRLYDDDGPGALIDIAPIVGLDNSATSFCVAKGDLDNDGDLDLVVQTDNAPLAIFINHEGDNRNWVKFRVVGIGANTFAVGAQIDIGTGAISQMNEITAGSNFKSQDDYTVHFGVDTATTLDQIIVAWPGGVSRTLTNYPANQTWTLWPPERLGDVDGDGDKDAADLASVLPCVVGPTEGSITPGCEIIDFDGNGAIDLVDYALFTQAVN